MMVDDSRDNDGSDGGLKSTLPDSSSEYESGDDDFVFVMHHPHPPFRLAAAAGAGAGAQCG